MEVQKGTDSSTNRSDNYLECYQALSDASQYRKWILPPLAAATGGGVVVVVVVVVEPAADP